MAAFLISTCLMIVVMAILHVLLGRWGLREQDRIAARHRAAASSPSLVMPEPDEDEERERIRKHRLLDEISSVDRAR